MKSSSLLYQFAQTASGPRSTPGVLGVLKAPGGKKK